MNMDAIKKVEQKRIIDLLTEKGNLTFTQIYREIKIKHPYILRTNIADLIKSKKIITVDNSGSRYKLVTAPKMSNQTNIIFHAVKELNETQYSLLLKSIYKWRTENKLSTDKESD